MKVLAYTSPARGHLFPLMPILDELSSRGHEISVRTLASQVPMLRERGFDAKPISAESRRSSTTTSSARRRLRG